MRWLRGVALLVIALVVANCGGASDPQLPDAELRADRVVGRLWSDDGNGRLDPGEHAVRDAAVTIGSGDRVLLGTEPVVSDEHGGFVAELGTGAILAIDADTFIQVTIPVDGPDGSPVDLDLRQPAALGTTAEVPIALPVRCADDPATVLSDPTSCGAALLPDLVPMLEAPAMAPTQPLGAASARIDTDTTPGRVLLRFASATANLGTGPLHMIPSAPATDDSLPTWQRIWTDSGDFIDLRTGTFVFHETHDHFHLEGFERYRLLDLDGREVATSEKISFCLVDSVRADTAPPIRGFGVFPAVACDDAARQQSLNPGWADYYGAGLPDQWIDITGVAPGDYLIEIEADPDNLLIELDETNNVVTFPITLDPEDLDPDA